MALFGENTKLELDGVEVPCLTEISGNDSSVDEVEITCIGDTHKRFRPSKISEAGTFSFSCYYDPSVAVHQTIRTLADTPETKPWDIIFSDGTTFSFDAFVTSANVTGGNRDAEEIMLEVECRIDGKVTETVAVVTP